MRGDGDATVRHDVGDSPGAAPAARLANSPAARLANRLSNRNRFAKGQRRRNRDRHPIEDRDRHRNRSDNRSEDRDRHRNRSDNRRAERTDNSPRYRRGQVTWAAFGLLLAFGVLNAGLGPALPYLRAAEHISYLASVLHQVAFAVGGGLAGVLTAHVRRMPARAFAIRAGLLGAGLAWLVIGYGDRLAITVLGAFMVSVLATTALIRLWAVLADVHGERRVVAMSEGEVAVSLGGVISPLLVSVAAATMFGWRGAFALGTVLVWIVVAATAPVRLPPSAAEQVAHSEDAPREAGRPGREPRVQPTLVIVAAIVALEFALTFWLASYLGDSVGISRRTAAAMVSALYVANLAGRLLASWLAHRVATEIMLAGALVLALAGLPILLIASGTATALIGLAIIGVGIGATFPLTSALHVAASRRNADRAVGQVLVAASVGQVVGPVIVAALAQGFGLRIGMTALIGFALVALGTLRWHVASSSPAGSR